MKARFGKKIIDVVPDDGRWLDPRDMTYYDADQLVFEKEVDWDAFRREAAKEILVAEVNRGRISGLDYDHYACCATMLANDLVEALKTYEKNE